MKYTRSAPKVQNKENSFKLFQNIVKDVNQKYTYRKSSRVTDDGERLQVTRLANTPELSAQ